MAAKNHLLEDPHRLGSIETGSTSEPSAAASPGPGEATEKAGRPLVSVLFSVFGDAYQVPSMNKGLWLSVARFPYDVGVKSANGHAWRKSYPANWTGIKPGLVMTFPADDVLVADYASLPEQEKVN